MGFQCILFSGFFHALFIRGLAGSDLFDDVEPLPDMSLGQENLASDNIDPLAQDFYDDLNSMFTTAFPNDVSTLAPPDNLDSLLPSLSDDGSNPGLSLLEDPGCSSDVNPSINKRETGKTCTTDSTKPSTPDQPFQRGGSTDPEFYGIDLVGFERELLGLDEEKNGCDLDVLDQAQFLVCDSGHNDDRFIFYTRNGGIATAITLKNCERSMYGNFFPPAFLGSYSVSLDALLVNQQLMKRRGGGTVTLITRTLCIYPRLPWCCQFFFSKRDPVRANPPPGLMRSGPVGRLELTRWEPARIIYRIRKLMV